MKVDDMQRLRRTENNMMRWMSGVIMKDRRSCEELRQGLGIESVDSVVSRGRLRWYGHAERKTAADWVSNCRNLKVEGVIRKGRGIQTWLECVATDMKRFDLKKEDAQDRSLWSSKILFNLILVFICWCRLTRAFV